MPILSRKNLPVEVRLPHLNVFRDNLRGRMLLASSETERKHLQSLLDRASDDKAAYSMDSPPPLGAIDPTISVKGEGTHVLQA